MQAIDPYEFTSTVPVGDKLPTHSLLVTSVPCLLVRAVERNVHICYPKVTHGLIPGLDSTHPKPSVTTEANEASCPCPAVRVK